MKDEGKFSRRDFVKSAGLAALSGAVPSALGVSGVAHASAVSKRPNSQQTDRYNILMIVTDQERYLAPGDLPRGIDYPATGTDSRLSCFHTLRTP
jgi:hypothetical protein